MTPSRITRSAISPATLRTRSLADDSAVPTHSASAYHAVRPVDVSSSVARKRPHGLKTVRPPKVELDPKPCSEPPLSVASEEGEADQAAIRRAVLDYVESAYDVKPELVDRSVSRDLAKIGFTQRDGDSEWRRHDMNFDQLRALVANWNADGHMPSEPRKDVAVLDRLDKIASAKVTAEWGVDYFQLEQSDDGAWHIRHVLWQSHPRKADEAERDAAGR